jgi:hypothetical protein
MAKVVKITSHKNLDTMVLDSGKVVFVKPAVGPTSKFREVNNYLKSNPESFEAFWLENNKLMTQSGDKISDYLPGSCNDAGDCLAWNKKISNIADFLRDNSATEHSSALSVKLENLEGYGEVTFFQYA